ncbi:MAG TPA: hypothetical protein PLJ84_04585 [Bacteroidales bacterium]|nr:hypothetical protein [Bacteroidales bacterium]HPT01853.1 hypothetical protein [Bacteroidales bacterium]
MNPKPKCLYCNKSSAVAPLSESKTKLTGFASSGYYYCGEACHEEILQFDKRVKEKSARFLILMAVSALSYIPLMILSFLSAYGNIFMSLSIASPLVFIGIVMIVYPFATPETNRMWGIRKSITVIKRLGYALAFSGVVAGTIIYLLA